MWHYVYSLYSKTHTNESRRVEEGSVIVNVISLVGLNSDPAETGSTNINIRSYRVLSKKTGDPFQKTKTKDGNLKGKVGNGTTKRIVPLLLFYLYSYNPMLGLFVFISEYSSYRHRVYT